MIWKSLTDFDLYPLYLIGLTFGIAGYRQSSPSVSLSERRLIDFAHTAVKQYLQISFKSLGFSTVNANLLTVPSTVAAIFLLLGITILSEAVDNRASVGLIICLPLEARLTVQAFLLVSSAWPRTSGSFLLSSPSFSCPQSLRGPTFLSQRSSCRSPMFSASFPLLSIFGLRC